jgi:hypothetical protein
MSTCMNNSQQQLKFMIKGSLVQQGRSENRHKDLLVMLGAEMRTQIEKCYWIEGAIKYRTIEEKQEKLLRKSLSY